MSCRCNNAKEIFNLLTCISDSKKEQQANIRLHPAGIDVTVQSQTRTLQSQSCLSHDLFQEYSLDNSENADVEFEISLKSLIDCLTIFGIPTLEHTSLSMAYNSSKAVFSLTLQDEDVITECDIQTFDAANSLQEGGSDYDVFNQRFKESPIAAKAIINSRSLMSAFIELSEIPGAASVKLHMSHKAPYFELSADVSGT